MKVLIINGKEIPLQDPEVVEYDNRWEILDGNEKVGTYYRRKSWIIYEAPEDPQKLDKELLRFSVLTELAADICRRTSKELEKRAYL